MQHVEEAIPEWLDKSLLLKAMKSYKHDETIEVLDFNINTGFSEHFASTMFQSKVVFRSTKYPKLEPETLSVVIKAKPVNEGIKMKVVSSGPLFETEIQMYTKTIPAIHQLFERSGMKVELEPKLIYTTDKPFPIIILKDLTQDGFFAPRQPPDDIEDSKLIIQKLAQFHAASYYLAETKEQDFSNLTYNIYHSPHIIEEFFSDTLKAFRETVKTWDGYEEYLPKIDNLMVNIAKIGQKSYTANKPGEGYNVLNHGDFHLRNTLIKHNAEKRLESVYFIDYQVSVYCSPSVDLNYFFGMVKRDEEGEIPTEELIMFYHQEFVRALTSLGFMKPVPSLLDLNVELLKHGATNCMLNICFLPFSFVDWKTMNAEDLLFADDAERANAFRKSLYEIPVCKKVIQKEMKSWAHKGWF